MMCLVWRAEGQHLPDCTCLRMPGGEEAGSRGRRESTSSAQVLFVIRMALASFSPSLALWNLEHLWLYFLEHVSSLWVAMRFHVRCPKLPRVRTFTQSMHSQRCFLDAMHSLSPAGHISEHLLNSLSCWSEDQLSWAASSSQGRQTPPSGCQLLFLINPLLT